MSRINGKEELWVGGIFSMRTADSLRERTGATHILSALAFSLEKQFKTAQHNFVHKAINLLDFADEDILTHIPEAVRFIENAFYPASKAAEGPPDLSAKMGSIILNQAAAASGSSRGPVAQEPVNSVFVHCAMGKSRSVTLVVAWLLYKYPNRWRVSSKRPSQAKTTIPPEDSNGAVTGPRLTASPQEAVDRAINWVRDSRSIAEPNEGFHQQLQLWWQMGCPIRPGAMEAHPAYARWLYKREVEAAVSVGVAPAPEALRFEDEEATRSDQGSTDKEYRCSKCRGRLCDSRFVQEHVPTKGDTVQCPHVFVEPLSWMRDILERGEMDGRLACPGRRCGNQVGRYSWKGFKCSCGQWVTPAFSLQRSKVDEVHLTPQGQDGVPGPLLRFPPGARKENL